MKKPMRNVAKKSTKKAVKKISKKSKAISRTAAAKKSAKRVVKKVTKSVAKKVPAKKAPAKKAVARSRQKPHHPFNWHDLMTHDVAGAKAFYGAVVGWTFEPQGPEYETLMAQGQGIGGIMPTPENMKGMPPVWSGYVMVKDVDRASKAIQKGGGTVHREPWDIPETVRMAVVSDPSGAVFNVYKPLGMANMKPLPHGTPGTIGWNENFNDDVKATARFYEKHFGWKKGEAHDMGPEMGPYQVMHVGKFRHAGLMKRMAHHPRSHWGYYFLVAGGIDAAVKRITDNGGKIVNGPMEVPTKQWTVNAVDPQGAHFSLLSATK